MLWYNKLSRDLFGLLRVPRSSASSPGLFVGFKAYTTFMPGTYLMRGGSFFRRPFPPLPAFGLFGM